MIRRLQSQFLTKRNSNTPRRKLLTLSCHIAPVNWPAPPPNSEKLISTSTTAIAGSTQKQTRAAVNLRRLRCRPCRQSTRRRCGICQCLRLKESTPPTSCRWYFNFNLATLLASTFRARREYTTGFMPVVRQFQPTGAHCLILPRLQPGVIATRPHSKPFQRFLRSRNRMSDTLQLVVVTPYTHSTGTQVLELLQGASWWRGSADLSVVTVSLSVGYDYDKLNKAYRTFRTRPGISRH